MKQVVIVDDEVWIRKGIIEAVNWHKLGLELAGEAADGDEAYLLVTKIKPDILLLDMCIPGMDGAELLRKLRETAAETICIVISGYSDFIYTKEAIRNGAFDYLLKPIDKNELNAVLSRAVLAIKGQINSGCPHSLSTAENVAATAYADDLEKSSDDKLRRLVLFDSEENLSPAPDYSQFCVCVCRYDRMYGSTLMPRRPDLLSLANNFFNKYSVKGLAVATEGQGRSLVFLIYDSMLNSDIVSRTLEKLSRLVRVTYSTTISIGIGSTVNDPRLLHSSYLQACKAFLQKKVTQTSQLLFFSEASPAIRLHSPLLEDRFLYFLQNGSSEDALKQFKEILDDLRSKDITINELQKSMSTLWNAADRMLSKYHENIEHICSKNGINLQESVHTNIYDFDYALDFFQQIIKQVSAFTKNTHLNNGRKIIHEISADIQSNYFNQLLLCDYADRYAMNPNYLSRLFKKTMGKNFQDYLTEIRVSFAKELLSDTSLKNFEIARMVGYEDYRHFSQIFKKETGMTAGAYRKKRKKRR